MKGAKANSIGSSPNRNIAWATSQVASRSPGNQHPVFAGFSFEPFSGSRDTYAAGDFRAQFFSTAPPSDHTPLGTALSLFLKGSDVGAGATQSRLRGFRGALRAISSSEPSVKTKTHRAG